MAGKHTSTCCGTKRFEARRHVAMMHEKGLIRRRHHRTVNHFDNWQRTSISLSKEGEWVKQFGGWRICGVGHV